MNEKNSEFDSSKKIKQSSWKLGEKLEAKDYLNEWYPAKIIAVDEDTDEVLVHFEGWNQRYDEWMVNNEERLRPLTPKSLSIHSKTRKRSAFSIDQRVKATWKDGKCYSGVVKSINQSTNKCEILFFDGMREQVDFDKVFSYTIFNRSYPSIMSTSNKIMNTSNINNVEEKFAQCQVYGVPEKRAPIYGKVFGQPVCLPCPQCCKVFRNSSNLNVHLRHCQIKNLSSDVQGISSEESSSKGCSSIKSLLSNFTDREHSDKSNLISTQIKGDGTNKNFESLKPSTSNCNISISKDSIGCINSDSNKQNEDTFLSSNKRRNSCLGAFRKRGDDFDYIPEVEDDDLLNEDDYIASEDDFNYDKTIKPKVHSYFKSKKKKKLARGRISTFSKRKNIYNIKSAERNRTIQKNENNKIIGNLKNENNKISSNLKKEKIKINYNINETAKTFLEEVNQNENEQNDVRCYCGSPKKKDLVKCSECLKWQHRRCTEIWLEDLGLNARINVSCFYCQINKKNIKKCQSYIPFNDLFNNSEIPMKSNLLGSLVVKMKSKDESINSNSSKDLNSSIDYNKNAIYDMSSNVKKIQGVLCLLDKKIQMVKDEKLQKRKKIKKEIFTSSDEFLKQLENSANKISKIIETTNGETFMNYIPSSEIINTNILTVLENKIDNNLLNMDVSINDVSNKNKKIVNNYLKIIVKKKIFKKYNLYYQKNQKSKNFVKENQIKNFIKILVKNKQRFSKKNQKERNKILKNVSFEKSNLQKKLNNIIQISESQDQNKKLNLNNSKKINKNKSKIINRSEELENNKINLTFNSIINFKQEASCKNNCEDSEDIKANLNIFHNNTSKMIIDNSKENIITDNYEKGSDSREVEAMCSNEKLIIKINLKKYKFPKNKKDKICDNYNNNEHIFNADIKLPRINSFNKASELVTNKKNLNDLLCETNLIKSSEKNTKINSNFLINHNSLTGSFKSDKQESNLLKEFNSQDAAKSKIKYSKNECNELNNETKPIETINESICLETIDEMLNCQNDLEKWMDLIEVQLKDLEEKEGLSYADEKNKNLYMEQGIWDGVKSNLPNVHFGVDKSLKSELQKLNYLNIRIKHLLF